MKKLLLGLMSLAALSGTGCFGTTFRTNLEPGGARYVQALPYFIGGLIGEHTVDFRQICPQGVARWKVESTFLDMCLTGLTGSCYSPRTLLVECAGGRSFRMTSEPVADRTLVEPLDNNHG